MASNQLRVPLRFAKVELSKIVIGDDRLPIDEKVVMRLVEDIPNVGLLNPIIVRKAPGVESFALVAGRNRLEAYTRLGHKTIPAQIENRETLEVREWAELAEIDENLVRRNIGAAQHCKLMAARKKLYEAVHPDAPKGRGSAGGGRPTRLKPNSFIVDTAAKTGQNKTHISNIARQGNKLGSQLLDRVTGTSLDSLSGIRTLERTPATERDALVEATLKTDASKPKGKHKPKTSDAETFARKSFLFTAADAALSAKQLLVDLKGKKHDSKVLAELDRATDKVLDAWNKVKAITAKKGIDNG